MLNRYLASLFRSAEKLGLNVPVGKEQIHEMVEVLLTHSATPETGIRLLLTAGPMDGGQSYVSNFAVP